VMRSSGDELESLVVFIPADLAGSHFCSSRRRIRESMQRLRRCCRVR
jgi:hypothetical protein